MRDRCKFGVTTVPRLQITKIFRLLAFKLPLDEAVDEKKEEI